MRTFCIACKDELPDRYNAAMKHFLERDVPVEFVYGIHGETFGIMASRTEHRYANGYFMPQAHVGLCLSHYMLWQSCYLCSDERIMILEDDAEFCVDWKERTEKALDDAPEDWDIILIGNSNCSDKPQEHIKGDIYEVKYPFCTHSMIINRKALPTLLEKGRDATMKVDIMLMLNVYPHLKVYSVIPRIVSQRGTDLCP